MPLRRTPSRRQSLLARSQQLHRRVGLNSGLTIVEIEKDAIEGYYRSNTRCEKCLGDRLPTSTRPTIDPAGYPTRHRYRLPYPAIADVHSSPLTGHTTDRDEAVIYTAYTLTAYFLRMMNQHQARSATVDTIDIIPTSSWVHSYRFHGQHIYQCSLKDICMQQLFSQLS